VVILPLDRIGNVMAKNHKKTLKLMKKLRMRAQFLGVTGAQHLGQKALVARIQRDIGVKTFNQFIVAENLTSDWDYFVHNTKMSRRRARIDKAKVNENVEEEIRQASNG
jgi:hypothetical protein